MISARDVAEDATLDELESVEARISRLARRKRPELDPDKATRLRGYRKALKAALSRECRGWIGGGL